MTGRELRDLRLRLEWTQEHMARKLGIARNTLSRYERGARPVPRAVELAAWYLTHTEGEPPQR